MVGSLYTKKTEWKPKSPFKAYFKAVSNQRKLLCIMYDLCGDDLESETIYSPEELIIFLL